MQVGDDVHQLLAGAFLGQTAGVGGDGVHAAAAEQGVFRQFQPFVQGLGQDIPLPFFHGYQSLNQLQHILFPHGFQEAQGLRADGLAVFQQLLGLAKKSTAARSGGQQILPGCGGELLFQLSQQYLLGQGEQLQLRAPGADRGQQLIGIVRQQEEHAVFRGLLQHLQQGVLSRQAHVLGPGEEVELVIGFVGLDIHIRPGLTDQVHRDGLFLRVVHGDEVRVGARQHLPAGGAAKAGLPLPPAEDGRRQEPGQGVLSRPGGAGDQIEMGDMPHGNAPGQILFQLFIAQEGFKRHIFFLFHFHPRLP